MYVFDERISVEINHVDKKLSVATGLMAHLASAINCANPECNRQFLTSEENQAAHLGACSYDCAIHEHNRYVEQHGITEAEKLNG